MALSVASASVLRFRDLSSLFPEVPAVLLEELKYECIGNSPDMDVRGPIMVHALLHRALSGQRKECAARSSRHATRFLTRRGDVIHAR